MFVFEKLRGTIESIFQFGLGGPNLKNNAGVIEARDAADAGFAQLRAAPGSNGNDVATISQVQTNSVYTTIGSNGEFFSVKDAYDSGRRRFAIVGAVVTESVSLSILEDIDIWISPTSIWRISSQFSVSSGVNVRILGGGTFRTGVIGGAFSGSGHVFFEGCRISQDISELIGSDATSLHFFRCEITKNNNSVYMFNVAQAGAVLSFVECKFIGTGTVCSNFIKDKATTNTRIEIRNCSVEGTWSATTTDSFLDLSRAVLSDPGVAVIDGLFWNISNTGNNLSLGTISGHARNIIAPSKPNSVETFMSITGEGTIIEGCDIGHRKINPSNAAKNTVINSCVNIGAVVNSFQYSNPVTWANCHFFDGIGLSTISISGTDGIFNGCVFEHHVSVSSSSHRNMILGCRVSDPGVTPGGTKTISIQAGAADNRVISCTTDAPISDAGTNTALFGNVVI